MTATICSVCGGSEFTLRPILWQGLVDEWQLSPSERAYVDLQQGKYCDGCGANLRSIALSNALLTARQGTGTLSSFVATPQAAEIKLLELNEAGTLSTILRRLPGHVFGAYPEVDMHALPYPSESFDLVVHSDTLEHVPNPLHALGECRRVLSPGGALCFTVPVIIGRMSRSRVGLPKSYHGDPTTAADDFVVQTEFGADAWTYPMRAGFSEVRLYAVEYPAGLAVTAFR